MTSKSRTLGETLRDARLALDLGLRELAKEIELTPSYLSDIENDRRVPSEDVLGQFAKRLNLSFDELMSLAGRVGDQAERYLKREPMVGVLFRRISEKRLSADEIGTLLTKVDKMRSRKGGGGE